MKRTWLLCIPVLCFIMISCTKDPLNDLTEEESRIYVTNHDSTVSFSNYTTFKIADSVALITNNQFEGRERTTADAQFIEALATGLQQRGFTRVTGSQSAHLGVTLSAITNTNTQVVSYNDYGGYYGGSWDPYYWGYSGYDYYFPPSYGVYQTNETALAVDIVDLKNAANSNQIKVVWSGLIRGAGIFSAQNAGSNVSELLAQSPYINKQ